MPRRESMYIDDYLEAAEEKRWTPHTFLSRTLRGKAATYAGGYYRALSKAIQRRVDAGTVVPVRSARGSTAYIRTPHN